MQLIKVGAAALNQTPLDWDGNKKRILLAIEAAKFQGISLLCLPELCITGYGCEDAFHSRGTSQTALSVLEEMLPYTKGIAVSFGLPLPYQNALFNVAAFVADGEISGFVAKRFLAGDGIHYEPRWFKAWPEGTQVEVELLSRMYPLGDLYFDCDGIKVGFEICEDAWVAKRPGSDLSLKGIDIILNPSASHFAFGKFDVRKRFVLEGSRAFGVSYIYANLLGNESGRVIFDGGALIASQGKLVAAGPRFSFEDIVVTEAVVDVDGTRTMQARTSSFRPALEEETTDRVKVPFSFAATPPGIASRKKSNKPTDSDEWESSLELKNEEFYRAVALGLFDYLRKTHCHGFVVSLSGGADSSAVSCLVHGLVVLGLQELGKAAFIAKLANPEAFLNCEKVEEFVAALLVCVYQSTNNSGEVTKQSAREVSQAIGATFVDWSVDGVVNAYVNLASQAIGRSLTWDKDDLALQNIQARSRAPGVWLLANLRNALLLVTSNRSEAAVGYATMDGDTAGALSPIGGVDKAFLRKWLVWMERQGPSGAQKIPPLSFVTAQAPTAELRPAGEHQTDETDLMPYDILDEIEHASILDRQTPKEIFLRLQANHSDIPNEQIFLWIEKFFKLWCRNQWKRERYAPSFHLDDESLDPKTWCRFPILSGGYERELRELREYVSSLSQSKSFTNKKDTGKRK